MKKSKNQELFKKPMLAYGGELRRRAKNRSYRPLVFRSGSVHLTLRSSQAIGRHSFQNPQLRSKVESFVRTISRRKGVQILSFANVGNHLHLHVKLTNTPLYQAWIRGMTSGLAMLSMGLEGFRRLKEQGKRFWDHRPFSQVIRSFRHFLNTKAYLEINILEGMGMPRKQAEHLIYGARKYLRSTA